MGVQLYPPIIPNVLNAMYNDGEDGIAIAIPFSLNRAVSADQINNFNIKIKTAFDNKTIFNGNIEDISNYEATTGDDADRIQAIESMIAAGVIQGHLAGIPALVVGQYYKVQVAFVNYSDETGGSTPSPTIGIYSNVATIKFTAKPEVDVIGELNTSEANIFAYTYQGSFDNSDDPSETRDQFRFDLLDSNDNIAFTSDWQFKNQYTENDEYTFVDIQENIQYKLRYGVKTINGVEVYSNEYPVIKYEVVPSELAAELKVANNFDNGYIELSLAPIEGAQTIPSVEGMFRILRRARLEDLWTEVGRKHFASAYDPSSWSFKDFLIEQGETYEYAIQQYNSHNIYSVKIVSDYITADFEDIFLYDGEKQLKIKFNPKVSSFKINRQEQKMETIGSQFPFFSRNGKIAYHEFPISGLCSYWMDEEELFITDEELGLASEDDKRAMSMGDYPEPQERPVPPYPSSGRHSRTTQLANYNFAAERRFKNTLLNWLGNGKFKYFKSPAEGNYIIRIMNPSLSPEDKLSRMIHNFSATGYEAIEINQNNLISFGFIKKDDEDFVGSGEVFNKILRFKLNLSQKLIKLGISG